MDLNQAIQAAIGAHGLWKGRLKNAIDRGATDVPVSVVQQDNQCKFGQWLYGSTIDASLKTSKNYAECRDLHRKFHGAAANILSLALAGKKTQALQAMAPGGEFSEISIRLTDAMKRWQAAASLAPVRR